MSLIITIKLYVFEAMPFQGFCDLIFLIIAHLTGQNTYIFLKNQSNDLLQEFIPRLTAIERILGFIAQRRFQFNCIGNIGWIGHQYINRLINPI